MFGNSDSAADEKISAIQKTHKFIKPLDHDLFGRIYIYQHYATQNFVIMKENMANNADHARQEEAMIEKRSLMRHPNLMIIKDWSVKATSKLCAEFWTIRAFYNYYIENVEILALRKMKENVPADDVTVMQLLYDGIEVLSYLQTQGYHHGFIRPDMFAVDENNVFVLSDRLLEGSALESQIYAKNMGLDPYCSPIIWDYLCNGKNKEHNVYKDDAFAFGLVLLRLANLSSPKEIYEMSGNINQATLSRLIEKAANRYEHIILFRQVLEKLLMIPEDQRADASYLKANMPVREQIHLFFNSETDDVYFDGPKSQMHNSMMGKDSILPYGKKAVDRSVHHGDMSNILGSRISPVNRQSMQRPSDEIFANRGPQYQNHQSVVMDGPTEGDQLHETGFQNQGQQPNWQRNNPESGPKNGFQSGIQNHQSFPQNDRQGFNNQQQMMGGPLQVNNGPQQFYGQNYAIQQPSNMNSGIATGPQTSLFNAPQPQPQQNFMRDDQSLEYDLPVNAGQQPGPSYIQQRPASFAQQPQAVNAYNGVAPPQYISRQSDSGTLPSQQRFGGSANFQAQGQSQPVARTGNSFAPLK